MNVRSLIEEYSFHTDQCAWHMTEFCDCGYREKIQEIRKQWNEEHRKVKWHCRRCGETVDMEKFRCGCEESPSPWEPIE